MKIFRVAAAGFILVTAPAFCQSPNPAALQSCIDSGSTSCTLAYGNWYFSKTVSTPSFLDLAPWGAQTYYPPLKVHSAGTAFGGNLTIDGSGSLLFSDGSTTEGILAVDVKISCAGSCTPGVKIQNFQFYNPNSFCSQTYSTSPAPPILFITQADIGAWPSNPFGYSGPWAVELYNNVFNCGQGGSQQPSAGVLVRNDGSHYTNDIYIHGNYFEWSTLGLEGGNENAPFATGLGCDTLSTFKDSTAIYNSRNINISGNTWRDAGEGSLSANHGRWVLIANNTFTDDQYVHDSGKYGDPSQDQGGVIFVDQCGDTVKIDSNNMTGPGGTSACPHGAYPAYCLSQTSGVELYGRDVQVTNNTIKNYFLQGVEALNSKNTLIDHNTMTDNVWIVYLPYGQISVFNNYGSIGTSPGDNRQGNTISITNNTIGTAGGGPFGYGITFPGFNAPTPVGIGISGNNISTNGSYGEQCYLDPFNSAGIVSGQYSSLPKCQ